MEIPAEPIGQRSELGEGNHLSTRRKRKQHMYVSEIETPAPGVDLGRMERNLARVDGYAKEHGLRLRPHTKTHKSVRIGGRQLEAGAAGP